MNETDGSYSANVTIANYVMDHHLEQSWRLAYIWGDADTYCLNNVTFMDSPRQTDRNCIGGTWDLPSETNDNCKGGVVVPGFRNAVVTENSTSFHINVSHYNRGYHTLPDVRLEYESERNALKRVTGTPGYL
ncbi:hypothetical protein HID58_011111, partial [Brassica napus]